MYIDYLSAAALADQVGSLLVGGRIQDVLQVDPLTVALEIYTGRRHYLQLGADPSRPGLRLSAQKVRRGAGRPQPLVLALASRAEGARLIGLRQPPFERILIFEIGGDEGVALSLVAELMGKLGNLILLDPEDRILACARQVTPEMSRVRSVLPGQPYQPPPPPRKADPNRIGAEELAAWLAEDPKHKAWRVLVSRFLGVSPLAAREMVARAGWDPEIESAAIEASRLLGSLQALMSLPDSGDWAPGLAYDSDLPEDGSEPDAPPAAYAPYRLTHYPGWRATESLVEAIEGYDRAREGQDAYAVAREAVGDLIEEARERVERQRAAVDRELVDEAEIDRLRLAGDLLLAYQWQIPRGASRAEVEGPDGPVELALDARLGAVENAERYYDRHRRARRAAETLPGRRAEIQGRLALLEQLASDLELAENRPEIDAVHEDLRQSGLLGRNLKRQQVGGDRSSRPMHLLSSDGLSILVGRNRRQNEIVTFDRGARGDAWLHVRGRPGAHVVVKAAGREVPRSTLEEAAGLAAWFSRARSEGAVEVIWTEVQHVSRMRGGGQGMVHFRKDRSLTVEPLDPRGLQTADRR